MAHYFGNTGNVNWNVSTNWFTTDGGSTNQPAIPTSADDVFFTVNSGACTMNIAGVAKSLNFSTYNKTITMNNNLTVSGNVTLSSSMTVSGTTALVINTTATLTSNGKVWGANLSLQAGTFTTTFADPWDVLTFTVIGGGTRTINGSTLTVRGSMPLGSFTGGTTNIIMAGTGSLSGAGVLTSNLTINTAGTITFASTGSMDKNFTYIAGGIVTTGNTAIFSGGAQTIDCGLAPNNMSFNNVSLQSTSTMTLLNDLMVGGNLTLSATGAATKTVNGFNVRVKGNLTLASVISGTTKLIMEGLAGSNVTWSGNNAIQTDFTINSLGTVNVSGIVQFGAVGKTLKYQAGSVVTGTSELDCGQGTLDTNVIGWNIVNLVTATANGITTLASDLICNTFQNTVANHVLNGANLNCTNLTPSSDLSGTTVVNINGATGCSWNGFGTIGNNLNIDSPGTVTLSTAMYFQTGVLTYKRGTIQAVSSMLTLFASGTLDTTLMTWYDVNFSNVNTYTLLSDLKSSNLLTVSGKINGFIAYCVSLSCVVATTGGTTNIIMNGGGVGTNGTWSGSAAVNNNLNINTTGSVTLATFSYGSPGNLTYTAGALIVPGSTFIYSGGTLDATWNAIVWNNLTFNAASYTLTKDWTCTGTFTSSGVTKVVNGFNITMGGLTMSTSTSGTTNFILKSGTWSGGGSTVSNNLTINPSGSVMISGLVNYNTGLLKYTAGTGTVDAAGSTLVFGNAVSSIDTNDLLWGNITLSSGGTTLISDLRLSGVLTSSASATLNTHNVYVGGGLSVTAFTLAGTATIILSNGTWSGAGTVTANLTLNPTGSIIISGTVNYNTGTLSYLAGGGTITTAGSTLVCAAATTFDTQGSVGWNNVTFSATGPHTLLSDLRVAGILTSGGFSKSINGASLYVGGNLVLSASVTGSSTIVLNSSGTQTISGAQALGSSLTFDATGTITGALTLGGGSNPLIKYSKGTMSISTITVSSSTQFDTSGMHWNNVTFSIAATYTMVSDMNIDGTFSHTGSGTKIINGNRIYLLGSMSVASASSGTTEIVFKGSGTWSGAFTIGNPVTIAIGANPTINGSVACGGNFTNQTGATAVTAGSTIIFNGINQSISSEGISWNNVTLSGSGPYIIISNMTCITLNLNSASKTINGLSINCLNLICNGQALGTATIVMTGIATDSGSWTSTGTLGTNLTFDSLGTITVSGSVLYGDVGRLKYVRGTMVTAGSTLSAGANCTLDTNTMLWGAVNFTTAGTYTLASNLNTTGFTSSGNAKTVNGSTIYTSGGLSMNNSMSGTTNVIMNGGTWSGGATLSNNLTLNPTGTIIVSGTVNYITGTLKYIAGAGTVNTAGSTLNIGAGLTVTFDTGGLVWNHLSFNVSSVGGLTYALLSDLNCTGTFSASNVGTKTFNGSNIYIGGSLTSSTAISGTSNLFLTDKGTSGISIGGTGTWSGTNTVSNNVTIDTTGTLTFSSDVRMGGTPAPKLKYVKGGISIPAGGFFRIMGDIIFDTNGMTFDTLSFVGSSLPSYSITILSKLSADLFNVPLPNITTGTTTFLGTAGFEVNTLAGCGYIGLFTPSVLYRVKQAWTVGGDSSTPRLVKSTIDGTKATITLDSGSVCTLGFVNFQDIDASGGRTITTFNGQVTNSINVVAYVSYRTAAKSYVE